VVNGAYGTWRKAIGQSLLLTVGGRYDRSNTDASSASAALYQAYHGTAQTVVYDSGFSGNLKLTWQSTSWASVFAGVGSNIRFPDPEERFFHSDSAMSSGWVGNPLLSHPRNAEYDLGWTAKKNRYVLNPLFFFSDLDDAITLYGANRLQALPGVLSKKAQTYTNVQAHQWGGEITGSAPLTAGIQVYGSLAYVRGTKVPQPQNNIHSSNLFQVPPLKTTMNVRYERRYFSSEISATVTGRQTHVDTDENEQKTAGYSVFNVRGGYHARRVNLEIGLNNALGRQYSEFLSFARNPYTNGVRLPEPGRNFFANFSYSFGHGGK
jgi:iron complex outermembrane receptor protein